MWRICGLGMPAAASASAGYAARTSALLRQFVHGDRGPDAQARRGTDYPAQLMDRLDVHHPLGRVQRVLHQADQVRAAGQHVGLAPGGRQQAGGFLQARRIRVFEGLHYAFLPSSASST
jgi:hypothetical protein